MRGYVDAMTVRALLSPRWHRSTRTAACRSVRLARPHRRTARALCGPCTVLLTALLLAAGGPRAVAQEQGTRPTGTDSVFIGAPDTIRLTDAGTAPREAKSPWGAVARSAIIPGWGQYYTEQYWKIPLIVGVSGFLIYGIVSENKQFQQYADDYEASITPENPSGDLTLKSYREYYRDRRDTYAVWMLVTYLIQLADAYVDAHLYDFDVSDDLSGSVTILPGAASFTLRW
jgi:hypothetical protein